MEGALSRHGRSCHNLCWCKSHTLGSLITWQGAGKCNIRSGSTNCNSTRLSSLLAGFGFGLGTVSTLIVSIDTLEPLRQAIASMHTFLVFGLVKLGDGLLTVYNG